MDVTGECSLEDGILADGQAAGLLHPVSFTAAMPPVRHQPANHPGFAFAGAAMKVVVILRLIDEP